MPRVLLFSANFPEYTIELANAMAKHQELILVLPSNRISDQHAALISEKITYRPFTLVDYQSVRDNFRMLKEIKQIIQTTKPKVIHVQAYGLNKFWWLWPLLIGRSFINTIHDPIPHSGDQVSQHNKWNQWVLNKLAKSIIVHGESLKQDCLKHLGLPAKKIHVIPHGHLGVYTHWRKKKYVRKPHTFLFFGRIWPYKGLNFFIEAANQLAAKRSDVRFIIAGKGESIEQYTQRILYPELFEIRNYHIPEEEIDELFQRASFTVLPYTDATQSGVIPVAHAYGVVVIAANVGALGEVITHGETGYLVPSRNADALARQLQEVLEKPHDELLMKANLLVQGPLNWNAIALETIKTYE
jgi:glycosyltransferase involved in cell wall biosynthesis